MTSRSASPAKNRRSAAEKAGEAPKPGRKLSTDRRAKIIELATRRFAQSGFEATTVRQIAEDAEILSGSLYHHFATKEEMLHDIVRAPADALRDEIVRIAALEVEPETRLVAMILFDMRELVRNHSVHAILFNERRLFRSSPMFADVLKAKTDMYRAWRSVLEAGIEAGQFDSVLDPYQTIRTVQRMLNSAADWYTRDDATLTGVREGYTLGAVEKFHLRFILGAIRNPGRAMDPIPFEAADRLLDGA